MAAKNTVNRTTEDKFAIAYFCFLAAIPAFVAFGLTLCAKHLVDSYVSHGSLVGILVCSFLALFFAAVSFAFVYRTVNYFHD